MAKKPVVKEKFTQEEWAVGHALAAHIDADLWHERIDIWLKGSKDMIAKLKECGIELVVKKQFTSFKDKEQERPY